MIYSPNLIDFSISCSSVRSRFLKNAAFNLGRKKSVYPAGYSLPK